MVSREILLMFNLLEDIWGGKILLINNSYKKNQREDWFYMLPIHLDAFSYGYIIVYDKCIYY